ncbi:M23 family metallopeptidase [Oxynema aestuarii]|jgi:murein DD-endopeptidase MepM/ murein hydrolase activator NlpD|uniref:M23 family metallopeptidase n=1 Tax=Oxynema aestuarii AP17 TaxID=2064643 RepID=A0A6H1TWH9_9CYAN|nr:M23 family metallopeptidase [Oxynema aestuarii]QIZ70968.1 M23 family metallopeptidase [Oxynema aestuarii AP17]RMH71847.1 MAG: M23 family metallopeptidase [Cyanobacteria bacterium J007]
MTKTLSRLQIGKKLIGFGRHCLIAVVALGAVLSLQLYPLSSRAVEVNSTSVATGNQWQNASFPVENFQGYTSPFGYRQSPTGGYSREFHSGLDIAAPMGSYVRNWWSGTVADVIDDGRCGTGLVIQSGDWEHIYCHMQGRAQTVQGRRALVDRAGGIQIWEGQQIMAGTRIGRVGMTGRSTGPHLHWGLRYADEWYDPALVLRAMYGEQRRRISQQP